MYHYAGNNPVRYTDPTGLFDWDTNTIEAGDTLSQIAKDCNTRYGTNYTAKDLQGLNSDTISDVDKIYAGNHLNLGKAEEVQKRAADYTSRATYTNQLENINSKNTSYGDITLGVNLNIVGCIGFDISFGILINLDNTTQSGIFFTGGFAAGASAGASVFVGYTPGKFLDENAATLSLGLGSIGGNIGFSNDGTISGGISRSLPIGIDAGFNISKQYGFVIPFDTPEQREKSMKLYYEHH